MDGANLVLLGACKCCELALQARLADDVDAAVAKALPVREMSSIARIELRAARLLHKTWRAKSIVAALGARRLVHQGAKPHEAASFVNAMMRAWAREVSIHHGRHLFAAYRLASNAARRRVSGKTKRTLVYSVRKADDDEAIKPALGALKKSEMMWVGWTYENIAAAIQAALEDGALNQLSRDARGKLVQRVLTDKLGTLDLGGWKGSAKDYFKGLAANAVTNARVQGQIDTFNRLGVKYYEVVNPMDERTSAICELMNGTVFEVSAAAELLEELRAAKTPEEYKSIHPWLGVEALKGLKAKGTSALVDAGVIFPPYHFFCRSTCDVVESTRLSADV